MKRLVSLTLLSVSLLSSTVQANGAEEIFAYAGEIAEDTVSLSAWYTEQLLRLGAINWTGSAIRNNLAFTKCVESWFSFLDKLPKVKQYALRDKLATLLWGAGAFAVARTVTGHSKIKRTLKTKAPNLDWFIHRLLDFKSTQNDLG